MEWRYSDENDNRIVAKTSWYNIENYENLENRSGVYIFADVNHQVKYIGKAGARRMVDEIADAISRGKDYGATRLKALYTNSDTNALSLERDLIYKYDPPNNLR